MRGPSGRRSPSVRATARRSVPSRVASISTRRERERLEEQLRELVEDPIGDLARVQRAGERPEEPRLPLAARGAGTVFARLADQQADHQRDREEDDAGRDVLDVVESERELRILHDQRPDRRGEDPGDQTGPQPSGHRRDHDREQEQRDRDLGSGRREREGDQGGDRGREHPDEDAPEGEPRGALGLVLLAHDHDTLAPFTGSSRLARDPSRFPHARAPEDDVRGTHPPSQSGGPTAPSSCRTSGSVLIIRARSAGPNSFPGRPGAELPGDPGSPSRQAPWCPFRPGVGFAPRMHVIIMGCGRVGSELSNAIADEHDVAIIDKNPEAFHAYPPGERARKVVGLGFDRDILEDAGIKDADAFVAVSSGDNSNIVSARVALEYYHVPKVIARIYDSRRAEIYERLNIPTVATTRWGVKQIQLMLFHDREEIRETLGGGDLLRLRVPVAAHLAGKPVSSLEIDGKVRVAGISRGGGGFIPTGSSTLQAGDYLILMITKEGLDLVDELIAPEDHQA